MRWMVARFLETRLRHGFRSCPRSAGADDPAVAPRGLPANARPELIAKGIINDAQHRLIFVIASGLGRRFRPARWRRSPLEGNRDAGMRIP